MSVFMVVWITMNTSSDIVKKWEHDYPESRNSPRYDGPTEPYEIYTVFANIWFIIGKIYSWGELQLHSIWTCANRQAFPNSAVIVFAHLFDFRSVSSFIVYILLVLVPNWLSFKFSLWNDGKGNIYKYVDDCLSWLDFYWWNICPSFSR